MLEGGRGKDRLGSTGLRGRQPTLSTLRLAWSLVISTGRGLLLAIVAASIVTSAAVAGQLILGRTLLDLLAGADEVTFSELAPLLLGLGCLLMVSAVAQAVATELRLPLGEEVQRRAMNDILDVATEVGLEDYEQPEFHNQFQLAMMGAGGQSSAIVFGLVTILSTMMVATGVILVLVAVAPVLVPISIAGYLPVAYINVRNNRERYQLERRLTELQRERGYLESLLTEREPAAEVRAYDLSRVLRGWYGEIWSERLRQLRVLVRRRLRLTTIGSAVTTMVLVTTLSFAVGLAARGSLSLGDAAVAIVGLQQLSSRLRGAGNAFTGVHNGITFLRDFQQFREELPKVRDARPTASPPSPPRILAVERLGYRYPSGNKDAVDDVSFELRQGQIMAIVGANGSGKTTVSKLVCGLLPPARGTIRWDGVDIAQCDPTLVRSQIAPVFQDYMPFMFTLSNAIGLGDVNRLDDHDAILRAASQAGLGELIETHGAGLDVRLGKAFTGGIDISLGQWQRVALARAFFRNAPVVVLDEPSASLDPRAEAELFDLLHSLCADRIVIFVSHRFATVRSADVVMVMDQGAVVEMGSHAELISARGLYHELFTLQADRYGL